MFTIVGGTYFEHCREPYYSKLYGSGLRAAVALSGVISRLQFVTCIGESELDLLFETCTLHNILPTATSLNETISFNYSHPLKTPFVRPDLRDHEDICFPMVEAEQVLYFGMAESTPAVLAQQLVYDPQSLIKFSDTNSKADRLAIVLNRNEAFIFSALERSTDLTEVGKKIRVDEQAEVVVIKSGAQGAFVFDETGITHIPIFQTEKVWPIGSGDVFSAVFAWKWMKEGLTAVESSYFASEYTALYCDTKQLPLPTSPQLYKPLNPKLSKKIYLAGPFFSAAERWLVEEIKEALTSLGCNVFSPFHELGISSNTNDAQRDLIEIDNCDVVFAIVGGLDPGTLFEIGYARAKCKKVIVLSENVSKDNLFMLLGSGCEIITDFSTAIYKASW